MPRLTHIFSLGVLLLLFLGNFSYSQSQEYKFRHLTSKKGLSSNYVYCVIKDSQGFMWFGTGNGLDRFDGYNIKTYKYLPEDSTSLSNNDVISLLELDSNHLLIGTTSGGLNILNKARERFIHFRHDPDDSTGLSHDRVNVLYRNNEGLIWVGTHDGLNLFHPDSGTFEVFLQEPDNKLDLRNQIQSLFEDSKGNFWIGTNSGLFRFDFSKEVFLPIALDPSFNFSNTSFQVNGINEDPFGYIWIGSNRGLFRYDLHRNAYIGPPFKMRGELVEEIEMITLNNRHYAWISTHWGLFQYDFQTNEFTSFYSIPGDQESVSNQSSRGLFFDDRGLLWIVTSEDGIDILNLYTSPFQQHMILDIQGNPYTFSTSEFFEDKEGNIWIGSHAAGLMKYNQDLKLIAKIKLRFSDNTEYIGGRVKKILQDDDGEIWLCMANPKPSVSIFNEKSKIFQLISYDSTNPEFTFRFPVLYIKDMLIDHQGNKWLGYYTGLSWIPAGNKEECMIRQVEHDELSTTSVRDLFEDKDGRVWIASQKGLFSADPGKNDSLEFSKYSCSIEAQNGQSVQPQSIFQDIKGRIWVGTNLGLYQVNISAKQYYPFGGNHKLIRENLINAITEDAKCNLWLATMKGLVKYNPTLEGMTDVKLFESVDGLPYEGSISAPLFKSRSGKIFVSSKYASQNGFYCFHPDSIIENTHIPPIVVTGFSVRNKPYKLDSNITDTRFIQLNYNENYFSFEFAALDYVNPEKNQYAYKLEGIDEDWIFAGNRRFASYTAIPPGNYTFRVKGSNNDGCWNESGAYVYLTIFPPPWRTWWAYTLYGLFLVSLFIIWRRYDLKRLRLKQELELEHVEAEKLKEMDSMKSRFFANISHEFRTPLTLILGPLDKLMKVISGEAKQDLEMMERNARRLQRLINQLLSLSKLESGQMKLQTRELNLVKLVNGYVQSFESLAKQRKIDLAFQAEDKDIQAYVDHEKLEKILYNLLSNAFKFTPEGGRISIEVHSQQSTVHNFDSRFTIHDSRNTSHKSPSSYPTPAPAFLPIN